MRFCGNVEVVCYKSTGALLIGQLFAPSLMTVFTPIKKPAVAGLVSLINYPVFKQDLRFDHPEWVGAQCLGTVDQRQEACRLKERLQECLQVQMPQVLQASR